MPAPDLRPTMQANVRQRTLVIAGGIAGVSTLALLATAAVLPLAGVALPPTIAWLSGLGANALAAWLDSWARQQTAQAIGQADDLAQVTALATALDQQLNTNQPLAEDLARLLQQGDLLAVALDGLQGQAEQQTRLLRMLTEDLQQTTVRNERLHAVTYQAVQQQSQLLMIVLTNVGSQLTMQLQDVIARLRGIPHGNQTTITSEVRNVNTGGGDYAEGSIDKRTVTFNQYAAPRTADPLPFIDPVEAIQRLAQIPTDRVPDIATLPPGSRITLSPNPLFTGRTDDLIELANALKNGRTSAVTAGMGGVGKTSLVVEFAHRYGQYFAGGVFWLSFASDTGIPGEIAACGGVGGMRLPGFEALTVDEQLQRVLAEWQSDMPRLLIFDNCEDPQLVRTYRPVSGGCRVLITSRNPLWEPSLGVAVLPLDVLPLSESIALLQRFRSSLTDDEAATLAEAMGDLPLALHLTGSFLARYASVSVAKYLDQLSKVPLEHPALQGRGVRDQPTDREMNLARAFAISYDRLNANDPIDLIAQQLLARAALFAPSEPFQRNLLIATMPVVEGDSTAMLDCADGLQRLIELGLIEHSDDATLRLHRLLAAYASAVVPSEGALDAVEKAIILAAHQANGTDHPGGMEHLVPHLRLAVERTQERKDIRTAILRYEYGSYLRIIGNYVIALPLFKDCLAIYEQISGVGHIDTAFILNDLALLHRNVGQYDEAKILYERALSICQSTSDSDDLRIASCLNNLGELLQVMGQYTEAMNLIEQALNIRQKALASDDLILASSLNNLAELLRVTGRYFEAKPIYERSLKIYRQKLGSEHPLTATSLNNLGLWYEAMEHNDTAKDFFEQALVIYKNAFGSRHPQTARTLDNLAGIYAKRREYKEARLRYEEALTISEAVFGMNHRDTVRCLNNLAELYREMGQYEQALPLYERALKISEAVLGREHPATASLLNNLAGLYQLIGQDHMAQQFYERTLLIRKLVLGNAHLDTGISWYNLACLLAKRGDLNRAIEYAEHAVPIFELTLGRKHPTTEQARGDLNTLKRMSLRASKVKDSFRTKRKRR